MVLLNKPHTQAAHRESSLVERFEEETAVVTENLGHDRLYFGEGGVPNLDIVYHVLSLLAMSVRANFLRLSMSVNRRTEA